MDNSSIHRIHGWVRQTRFRAKKYGCYVELTAEDVLAIYKSANDTCGYCKGPATSPDLAFPIKEKAPCVAANIIPCCEQCKIKKKNRDIVTYYKLGGISKENMKCLIMQMIARNGGVHLRAYMRQQLTAGDTNE